VIFATSKLQVLLVQTPATEVT